MKLRLMSLVLASLFTLTAQAQNHVVWSGGITFEERQTAPTTGTTLEFFVESGSYLANVKVLVKDMQGKVLVDTVSTGPWLILDLPAGKYNVRAEVNGSAQGSIITVEAGTAQKFGYMFKNQ